MTVVLPSKIISGGQTGVDRGAIEAAREVGFPYGGLIPKGRRAEDGIVPLEFDQMTESPYVSYLHRTEQNVKDADCTLIIVRKEGNSINPIRDLSSGTLKTYKFALQHHKPRLVIFRQELASVRAWLEQTAKELGKESLVLNVAGPRESKTPGIQAATKQFVMKLLKGAAE